MTSREPSSDPDLLRATLARDGFARLGPVLDRDEVQALCRELDGLAPTRGHAARHGIIVHEARHRMPGLRTVAQRLVARVCRSLGVDEIVLFQDHVVWKPPGTPGGVEWHQDFAYWPLAAPEGATTWLAIDDADADTGCLHYVPGSHHLGERAPSDFVSGATQPLREGLPPLPLPERMAGIEAVPVPAGHALVHHPLTWHMSPANGSARHRRAWSVSWVLPGALWDPAHAPHPFTWQLGPESGTPLDERAFPRLRG